MKAPRASSRFESSCRRTATATVSKTRLNSSLGLNPNNAADGLEDRDSDGLSNRDEVAAGSNLSNPDTDGDGIMDGEEARAGADGFITSPLLADTDGDGVRDGLEVATGSNPTTPPV